MQKIKALIPNSLKYPFWWVFKSPQRSLGMHTLRQDLKALFAFCFYFFFKTKKLQRISICTGIYNRSDIYLTRLVDSVNKAKHSELIELSVFDCGSDDVQDLEQTISSNWNGDLKFSKERVRFSRAYAFNKAVEQATSDIIFICDADMSVPENIVSLCNHYTSQKMVWYPIVFYVHKDQPAMIAKEYGHWMQYEGKGMLACRKNSFLEVGKLNEGYTEWGREDDDLWERFMKAGYAIIRNRQDGLLHHWHESFNPKYRKMAGNLTERK